ncbi:MAG TPA: lysylphosphatidylglycerol synthase transmembrane domain-containing protein [Steroidobacteraceae bacterium]|nr:lysylphosphatidylglycerol synthase transmembrane domain-containing protein [Steroidobacteraceae bacterium]
MKFWLRIALSVALVVVLFTYVVDAREVVHNLQRFDASYLLLALVVVTLDRILMTFKWTLLLRAQGYRLPLLQGVTIYCTSMVWGMALPATVGADAIRAVMVTKRGFNGTDVVASIVIERMVGFVLALALGLVSLAILRTIGVLDARFDSALYLGIAMLLGVTALLVAALNERLVGKLVTRLPRFVRESKVMQYLDRFAAAYRALGGARSTIAQFSALTVLEQVFAVIFPWVLAKGLDIDADLVLLLGVLPISTLISRLPISFDGLGVFEAVFVGLLVLAGINAEAALAIAISGRIIQLFAFLPWWFVHVARSGAVRPPTASKELPIN